MIPYRVKEKINVLRCSWYLGRAIEALSPLTVATRDLQAEVHMMVGHNHLVRGLAALYTFFHHSGLADRVGVMFHLDGTVTTRQREWLARHVVGAAFTDFPSTDERVRTVLDKYPYCARYYLGRKSCMTRLVHIPVFARSKRVINLDSDVVFWNRPCEMVDWVRVENPTPFFSMDHNKPNPDPGEEVRQIFEEILRHMHSPTGVVRIPSYYFCAGMLLLPVRRFSFDLAEDYFRWWATVNPPPNPRLYWFREWTLEQTAFLLNYAAWPDSRPLDAKYGSGAAIDEVCTHFLNANYWLPHNLRRVRGALDQMVTALGREDF
jgi:hypothetical protein